jgi:uncharacterized protein YndB with AHSA1/START domain
MFKTTAVIAASPEDVWAVLVDVERWPEWTASMSEVKVLNGRALAVGARVQIKQPRLPSTVWEVTTLEPLRGFTWLAAAPGSTTVADHRLTAVSAGHTTVTLTLRRTGLLARLLDLVFKRVTEKYVRMEAEGLKRRCETAA